MPLTHRLQQVLSQRIDLGRRDRGVLVVHQAWMQTQLPQQREGSEDRYPVPIDVAEQAEQLLSLALQMCLVHLTVPWMQRDLEHLLLFRWQLRRDLLFRTTTHEGTDPLPQGGQQL